MNARLVEGVVVHEGAQVVLGDTATGAGPSLFGQEVHYQVLCRRHWARRQASPDPSAQRRMG